MDMFLLPSNKSLATDFGLGSAHPMQASSDMLKVETHVLMVL